MDDPNAIIGVVVRIVMPSLFCVAGQVEVAGLWSQPRPHSHVWNKTAPPRPNVWQTTELPGPRSGGF
jgi:hypothetical protein